MEPKWTYDDIYDEELFRTCKATFKKQRTKRPSTFVREHNRMWKVRATCRNAADNVITAMHISFCERSEYAGQLSKSGGNSDLIEYISKEVVTRTMLRERFLKRMADDLDMKKDLEPWCDV